MKLRFTKMQGAGNDFVVLDATQQPMPLTTDQLRRVADRRFGVGCDQILVIEAPSSPDVDFGYRIFNSDGSEVEQCGNGARCFVRFVVDKGLTSKRTIRVQTVNALLELRLREDGRVTVDMGAPIFDLPRIPFDPRGTEPKAEHGFQCWPLDLGDGMTADVAVLSMGNPHAVQRVDDVDQAPVGLVGPLVETHEAFPRRVNAGFLQVLSRNEVKLRVFERGAGETLACGTGACAAVVAGIRLGWLDEAVEVHTRGGDLRIEWAGMTPGGPGLDAPVYMTGPAQTVFEGEIEL
ncbi:diaminopimelate epimerase [Roseateles chitinivorans]|uniref:Diaminopimelate epimerase n=1 Tax=Roseateles chitinivorans TaxID=2917965 RepID=A0A2G9CDP9_9BURK|nr:diaminopimelate epimerase [Roseateles chitinivorans]PIM54558.1 diaminopimelate epimerase [Roseateles chitinivorans]